MSENNIDNLGIKDCRYCKSSIPKTASVCAHCNRDQKFIYYLLRADYISLFIALVMMIIAYSQLMEARRERIAADKAMQQAQIAQKAAEKTASEFIDIKAEILDQKESISKILISAQEDEKKIQDISKDAERIKIEISKLGQDVKSASAKVVELNKKAEEALETSVEVAKNQAPRVVSDEQQKAMYPFLINAPKDRVVDVILPPGDPEAIDFAGKLLFPLKSVGLNIKPTRTLAEIVPAGITIEPLGDSDPLANAIISAFKAAGFSCKVRNLKSDPKNLRILIGQKPFK